MKRILLALTTLSMSLAALGSAQAATPQRHADAQRLHDHVVESRAAQQRRWITAELRHHRLDATQAASLRAAVTAIERDQRALDARHHEDVSQALALSHRQDLLDWAIRSGRVDFEPQRIAALDAVA